jgi:hypothetical protein
MRGRLEGFSDLGCTRRKNIKKSVPHHICVYKISKTILDHLLIGDVIDDVGRTRTYAPEGN